MSRFASISPFLFVRQMPLALRTGTLLAFLLGGSLLLTTQLFEQEMNDYRSGQQAQLSQLLGRQSAQIAAVQILDGDGISLTVTADQLSQHPFISGVEIIDAQKRLLAKAGSPTDQQQSIPIRANDAPLGELRLYLDEAPQIKELSIAFYRTTLAAVITCALSWLVLFIYIRRITPALLALRQGLEQLQANDQIARLTIDRSDELGQLAMLLNQRFAVSAPEDQAEFTPDMGSAPLPQEDDSTLIPHPSLCDETDTDSSDHQQRNSEKPPTQSAPNRAQAEAPPPRHANEPIQPRGRQRYLLYVDHLSTASENLTPLERQQLLANYATFLQQVVSLYKGRFNTDESGNWCGEFEPLDTGESHGINALCAAQLFNALYRGINQRAIQQMNPVANIKMALLAGSESFSALIEEAEELCRQVEANALIVGEELFSVQPLVDRLLCNADSRTLEQPARLLNRLNDDYQTLIEQQAQHFLGRSGLICND